MALNILRAAVQEMTAAEKKKAKKKAREKAKKAGDAGEGAEAAAPAAKKGGKKVRLISDTARLYDLLMKRTFV